MRRRLKLQNLPYTLPYLKRITNKDLLYCTGNSAHCDVAGKTGGWCGAEWTHAMCVWLNPFAVHPKLSQHCSSAIAQYKIQSFFWKKKKKQLQNLPQVALTKRKFTPCDGRIGAPVLLSLPSHVSFFSPTQSASGSGQVHSTSTGRRKSGPLLGSTFVRRGHYLFP